MNENHRTRSQYYVPLNFRLTPSNSGCVYGGCVHRAYTELRHYCTDHFLDVVVREAERKTRALNELWLRACELEQRFREEWVCKCGFVGTFETRDTHFVENPSYDHLPQSAQRAKIFSRNTRVHVTRAPRTTGYNKDEDVLE